MKQTPVTCEQLSAWSLRYNQSAERRLATLALSKTALNDVAFVSRASFEMKQKFSLEIPTLDVTNQQASGRCWLFAATNVLREKIAKDLNLDAFELSQSYLAFWDKFERANYFLESILETYVGHPVELIPCGGGDRIAAEREQWNDGSNTLCVRPGTVVVYQRNNVTNDVLYKQGINCLEMPSAELSRGRGGPRCMSMPAWREAL